MEVLTDNRNFIFLYLFTGVYFHVSVDVPFLRETPSADMT